MLNKGVDSLQLATEGVSLLPRITVFLQLHVLRRRCLHSLLQALSQRLPGLQLLSIPLCAALAVRAGGFRPGAQVRDPSRLLVHLGLRQQLALCVQKSLESLGPRFGVGCTLGRFCGLI